MKTSHLKYLSSMCSDNPQQNLLCRFPDSNSSYNKCKNVFHGANVTTVMFLMTNLYISPIISYNYSYIIIIYFIMLLTIGKMHSYAVISCIVDHSPIIMDGATQTCTITISGYNIAMTNKKED